MAAPWDGGHRMGPISRLGEAVAQQLGFTSALLLIAELMAIFHVSFIR